MLLLNALKNAEKIEILPTFDLSYFLGSVDKVFFGDNGFQNMFVH